MALRTAGIIDTRSKPVDNCYLRVEQVEIVGKNQMRVLAVMYAPTYDGDPTNPENGGMGVEEIFPYDLDSATGNLWQQAYTNLKTIYSYSEDV